MSEYKDAEQLQGEAITASLTKMIYYQGIENKIATHVVVRSLLTVATNVSAQRMGLKSTAAIFRTFATLADEKQSKRLD